MPTPREVTETYFVGLVLIQPKSKKHPEANEARLRYFTLELGYNPIVGCKCTMLCEWTHDAHGNFGEGPPPDVAAFVRAISRIVK
jgi:hypothetical protein